MPTNYRQNMAFEEEVRWIAEAVWDMDPGDCQPQHYSDTNGVVRELDGIARLRDVTHLLMATTSTRLEKVKGDVRKLGRAETFERKPGTAVTKWLITKCQLDVQHIDFAKKHNVTILTLAQFKHRFIDGREYIKQRELSAFGSARNPVDASIAFPDDAYVTLPMTKIETENVTRRGLRRTEGQLVPIDLAGIESLITRGEIVILMAPFGSGKSATTRELFKILPSKFRNESAPYSRTESAALVPICFNLREHWGQKHFSEILDRHARSIYFKQKEDLVLAWRAGLATILLDGFDEVASQTIVRNEDINFMKQARRAALAGVKYCLTKLPAGAGVFICGRDHYFDDSEEMAHAFGVSEKNTLS